MRQTTSRRLGRPRGLIMPLTKSLVSTTPLGAPRSLIVLLADLFDDLGHVTQNLVRIFVGVSLPDLLDNFLEALSILRSSLFDPLARLRADDILN